MNSLRHVFWRGAMALSLLTLGVGSGFGFREVPVQASGNGPACDDPALRTLAPVPATDGFDKAGIDRIHVDAARAVAANLHAQGPARRG